MLVKTNLEYMARPKETKRCTTPKCNNPLYSQFSRTTGKCASCYSKDKHHHPKNGYGQLLNIINKRKETTCPFCNSRNSTVHATRVTTIGKKTRLRCTSCKRTFTKQLPIQKQKQSPAKTILLALSIYENHTQSETVSILKNRHNIEVSASTIKKWKRTAKRINNL